MKPLVRILARFLSRAPRICTILQDVVKNSREKPTKVNENKEKPTPTAASSAYLLYSSCSRYQPSYHVLNYKTLCCHISNASKTDNAAGSANNSKIIVKKMLFVLQVIHFLDTLDKNLTKIQTKKFKRFVRSKNKQGLIKAFKSKRELVRICKILTRVSRCFALGRVFF